MRAARRPFTVDAIALTMGSLILSHTLGSTPAHADVLLWNNAGGGSASTAGNWNPAQAPLAGDDLVFNLLATYPVTFNSSSAASNTQVYKRGTTTLTCTSPHTIAGALRVGDLNLDLASMVLATGTMNVGASSFVGDDAGSTGTLTVNDDDADLVLTGATTDLFVGSNGTGTLNITAGGLVQVPDQFIAGNNATSISNVTVSGATVTLPLARSTLNVQGSSQSRLGQGGDATVNIANGALALFGGDLVVANGGASSSSVTISGIGGLIPQNATLDVAGDLLLGRNISALSAGGAATMNVNADGVLQVGDTLFVAGDPDGGTATLHTDTGGLVNTGTLNIGNGATLDFDGGEIDVDTGALVWSHTAASARFNGGVNDPVLTMRSNATATLNPVVAGPALVVGGGAGANSMDFDVRSGSDLTVNGSVTLGEGSDDFGGMIINGNGSTMSMSAGSTLTVGSAGDGRFEVELGGAFTGDIMHIAAGINANGFALIENPGTTATFDEVYVGGTAGVAGGSGDLLVNDEAVLNAPGIIRIWETGFMEVAQSAVVNAAASVIVRGDLELENGAAVHAGHVVVTAAGAITGPVDNAGAATLDSSVDMQPGSTLTLVNGDLAIGDADENIGFLAQDGTAITVGAHTLTLLDANRAQVDDITINGGHIIAPNGMEIVTPGTNGTLDGTGSFTGELFMESGGSVITATGANGITINGRFRNNSGNIDGTKYTFNNNPAITDSGWIGAGAIDAQVVFNAGTEVFALANMNMGDGSNFGVTFNAGSELYTNDEIVTLIDGNGVGLPSITELEDGVLACTQSLTANSGRTVRGRGDINTPLLTIIGSIRPGDVGSDLVGLLDVNGNLTLGAAADTYVHIAGDPIIGEGPVPQPFDIITGSTITINGRLEAQLLNGYSPAVGTVFPIIDGTSLIGTFPSMFLQRPGPGKNWLVRYFQPLARVELVVGTCIADVTYNGVIDVDDLLTVINGWGACPACPPGCQADTNADCLVDVNDLLAVINAWGSCP